MSKPKPYTVRQAAERIFGHADTATIRAVQRLIKSGKLPGAYQVYAGLRSPYLIPAAEVEALLSTRRQAGKKKKAPANKHSG